MDLKRMKNLLRKYSETVPEERLFSESRAAELKARLAESANADVPEESCADQDRAPTGAPFGARRLFSRKLIPFAVAAAVLFALSVPWWWGSTRDFVGLEADGGFQKLDLFRTSRAGREPGSDEQLFYVGVRTRAAAFVRIVAVDANESLESIPLDTQGRLTLELPAEQNYTFGGYEVRSAGDQSDEADITHFIVIASDQAIDAEELERALQAIARQLDGIERERLPDRLQQEFTDRLEASVRVIAVPAD